MTRLETAGWLIFLVGAVFYLVAAIRAGDDLSVIGAALFMLGIVLFLVPLARRRPSVGVDRRGALEDAPGEQRS